jgi:hypothetical protein
MTDIVDGGMPDNSGLSDIGLRDRIAAIAEAHYNEDLPGYTKDGCSCGYTGPWPPHLADAVIAELGLTRVTRSERVPIHRYITDWKADDETD